MKILHGSATVSARANAASRGFGAGGRANRAGRELRQSMISFIISSLAVCAPQQLLHEVRLDGLGDPNSNGRSFGLAYEPDQNLLYVALCGDLPFQGTPNSAIAVVELTQHSVVAVLDVGLFPEEIAFAHDPLTGKLRYGACTNSESGDVAIWDANLQVVATVPLPDPFGFGTCYPFGIATTDTHFLISTQDGSGAVHAIALANLALDPAMSFSSGPGRLGARFAVAGDQVWMADTLSLPGFVGSEGGLLRHDLTTGAQDSWIVSRAADFGRYPAAQDVVLLPQGGAWFGGTDLDGRLWRTDPAGRLDRALDLSGRSVYGLAADPAAQWLAACTLFGGELILIDLVAEEIFSTTLVASVGSGHALPNDALFIQDKLYVTCQGSESLLVFGNLPAPGPPPAWSGMLTLSDTSPDAGSTLTATVTNSAGGACWLLGADNCAPNLISGLPLRLGATPRVHASGTGSCSRSLTLPGSARLRGRSWFFQGVVREGAGIHRATAPKALVLQ